MQPLSLNLNLHSNRALNQDGLTALRSISVIQGETYDVSLNFYGASGVYSPNVSSFGFLVRDTNGNNITAVTSLASGASGYFFTLPITSPAYSPSAVYRGLFSLYADGNLELIEPFGINVTATSGSGGAISYVSALNGATGALTLAGAGNVTVSTVGQTITVSGASVNLAPYALSSTVVLLTGDQLISGKKTFAAPIYGMPNISSTGVCSIDMTNGSGYLLNAQGGVTLDWEGSKWYANGLGSDFIDLFYGYAQTFAGGSFGWGAGGQYFTDYVGNLSADFGIRYLCDYFGQTSLDWQNRQLYDDNGNYSLIWGSNRFLYGTDGNTVTLDWGNQQLPSGWTVPTPSVASGIANKAYVDSALSGVPSLSQNLLAGRIFS